MKTLILTVLASLFVFSANSKIWTVSNDAATTADFANIQDAIDSASAGDTIYIQGTTIYYGGDWKVSKRLTIIGPGKDPNTPHKLTARVSIFRFEAGSDSAQIIGLHILGYLTIDQADNILVQGCYITTGVSVSRSSGTVIRDNVIVSTGQVNPYAISSSSGANTATNLVIENNLIFSQFYEIHGATIRNNVFTRGIALFKTSDNNLLENNIFYGTYVRDCSSCTFNSNITYGASNDSLPVNYSGSGNIISKDPQFVDAPLSYNPTQFYDYNFHLKSSSPAIGKGTDNKNLGLYGGGSPATLSGNANIPNIQAAEVENSIVPAGGQVKIKIISTKPE